MLTTSVGLKAHLRPLVLFRAARRELSSGGGGGSMLRSALASQRRQPLFFSSKGRRAPLSSSPSTKGTQHESGDLTDFIESWTPTVFMNVGYGLAASTAAAAYFAGPVTGLGLAALTAMYWKIGLEDMKQTTHTIRRNFPLLGHVRYILESVRPEIRHVNSHPSGKPPVFPTPAPLTHSRRPWATCPTLIPQAVPRRERFRWEAV